MEEKINNQKIFSYVPPLVAKFILDIDLKDSDVFFNNNDNNKNQNKKDSKNNSPSKDNNNDKKEKLKKKNRRSLPALDSEFIKPNIFPISNPLP